MEATVTVKLRPAEWALLCEAVVEYRNALVQTNKGALAPGEKSRNSQKILILTDLETSMRK